jgi:hypothetical protein
MSRFYHKVNVNGLLDLIEFKDQGLQVIVKLASVELTPEKPGYGDGSWHLEVSCDTTETHMCDSPLISPTTRG